MSTLMEIGLEELPFDLDFHPSKQRVAVGLINGQVILSGYASTFSPQSVQKIHIKHKACRAVKFIDDGKAILSGHVDGTLLNTDVSTGSAVNRLKQKTPISRLVKWTEETIAFGDDKGRIKVWDVRQDKCCNTFHVHEDSIADMTYVSAFKTLVGVSGDGRYSCCDLVAGKIRELSPIGPKSFGLEYLSVVAVRKKQIICGAQTGDLQLHSLDTSVLEWNLPNELKNPVDAMVMLDDDNLIVGSAESINLMNLAQGGIFQRIGEHGNSSVQRLGLSYNNKYLGSISCGVPILKLWDLKDFMPDSGISNSSAAKRSSKVRLSERETPAKVEPGKKRSSDSEPKTPATNKKAKLATPQKTGGKTGGASHVVTPHLSKKTEEKPATSSNQSEDS